MARLEFWASYDADAGVWVAISDEAAMATQAATRDKLIERITHLVPDVLDARCATDLAAIEVRVAWQEMRTVRTTDLMLRVH